MALAQLIYVSQRTKSLNLPTLEKLVKQSASDNASRQITGVLMVCGSHLLQLLEGELTTITALFERIRTDPRHKDVACLICKNVNKRLFPEWGMGLADLDSRANLDLERMTKLVDDVRAVHDTSHHGVEARLLIADFKQQLRAA